MQFRDSKCVIYAVSQIKDMSCGSDVRMDSYPFSSPINNIRKLCVESKGKNKTESSIWWKNKL